jgi:hypothetical protein
MPEPVALPIPPTAKIPASSEPSWRELVDSVDGAAALFLGASEDLSESVERFSWGGEDAPEAVKEAAEDASLAVYAAITEIERQLDALRSVADAA